MSSAETTRRKLEYSLVHHALRNGGGDPVQRVAFQEMEWRLCKSSPEYFIDNYGWITDKAGHVTKWTLWPFQRELLREWRSGKSTCAVKARQLGVTTLSSHYALWEVLFLDAVKWHAISTSETTATDLVERLQVTLDRLPQWMTERASRSGKESTSGRDVKNAVKRIGFGMSSLTVLTSTPRSVSGKAGKFILDEFAKADNQRRVYQTLLPAFDGGGQAIIIANGNGENTFYHIYQQAKKGENGFVPHFYSWKDDPRRDDEWYERTRKQFFIDNPEADDFAFRAEFPSTEHEAFFLKGNSRFSLDAINTISRGLHVYKKDNHFPVIGSLTVGDNITEYRGNMRGHFRCYERPVPGADYVVGVDPAGGGQDADYSVAGVGKLLDAAQHEEWADKLGATELRGYENRDGAVLLTNVYQARPDISVCSLNAERLARWYNEALMVIERNNHGHAVIEQVKETYPNLWFDKDTKKLVDDRSQLIGYQANPASKTKLIDNLEVWLNRGWLLVTDSVALDELSKFEAESLKAPKGSHDDLVIMLGLLVLGARESSWRSRETRRRILDPFRE